MNQHKSPPESSRFRALRGAHFQRIGPDSIRVWREGLCSCCEKPVAVALFVMTSDNDRDPMLWGLKKRDKDPPAEGYSIYRGSMIYCGTCALNWRKGTANEVLGRVR